MVSFLKKFDEDEFFIIDEFGYDDLWFEFVFLWEWEHLGEGDERNIF